MFIIFWLSLWGSACTNAKLQLGLIWPIRNLVNLRGFRAPLPTSDDATESVPQISKPGDSVAQSLVDLSDLRAVKQVTMQISAEKGNNFPYQYRQSACR